MQQQFSGLNPAAIDTARKLYGSNSLPEHDRVSRLEVLLHQLRSPLIYVLVIVAVLSLTLGKIADFIVLAVVAIANTTLGFTLELRAGNTLASLRKLTAPTAKVLRGGRLQILPVAELVPGDVVEVEAGDRIPADGLVLFGRDLQIAEAQLTGESLPTDKDSSAEAINALTPELLAGDYGQLSTQLQTIYGQAEAQCRVFMTTNVVRGRGQILIAHTGSRTEIGKLSETLVQETPSNPLKEGLGNLSQQILVIVAIACIAIFIIGLLQGRVAVEMLEVAAAQAVSAVPEGLPMVVTVSLALGAWRMAQRKALLRNLASVTSLAAIDVICTDKTGTITQGKLSLEAIIPGGSDYSEEEILALTSLCCSAQINDKDEEIGDPLEISILRALRARGFDYLEWQQRFKPLDEIPFSSEDKFMATLQQGDGQELLVSKGALEKIGSFCAEKYRSTLRQLEEAEAEHSRDGKRCLLVAVSEKGTNIGKLEQNALRGLKPLALLVFSDPLRPEIAAIIAEIEQGGIDPILITGDQLQTARAIAESAGIFQPGRELAVTASELETLSDEELAVALQRIKVIARSTPLEKLRLVKVLQASGKRVAMTGDGVNDAPALKRADIGIAMGKTGTEVAKESADLILLDDGFKTIVEGIAEARTVWSNLRRTLSFVLSTSVAEIGLLFIALLLNLATPLRASQILWINLVTDAILILPIASEKRSPDVLKQHPSRFRGQLFSRGLMLRTIYIGLVMSFTSLVVILLFPGRSLAESQTIALTAIAVTQWFNALNTRSSTRSIFSKIPFNKTLIWALAAAVILQLGAVYWAPLQMLLSTTAIGLDAWIAALVAGVFVVIAEEIRKFIAHRVPHVN